MSGCSTYEVGVEPEAGGVSVREHERVDLKLSLKARQIIVVLHEDVRKLDRVSVGTSSVSDVADGVSDVRVRRVEIEVLSVPAVGELDGTVEVRVLRAGSDTLGEATLSALVP